MHLESRSFICNFESITNIHADDEDPEGDSSDAETDRPAGKPASKPASKTAGKAAHSPSDSEAHFELAHVLSIGHDSLMFEIWLESHTGNILTFSPR